ncbi:MAG: carbohydrate ABC transporter permease [Mycoplasmatales bacterium]
MKKIKINWGYLFVTPWIIGFFVFVLYPLITSFMYSQSKVTVTAFGVRLTPAGWDNYIYGLTLDPKFIEAIKETIVQLLLQIPLIIVISIVAAMLLNHAFKGVGFFRTIYFLPVVVLSGPTMDYMYKIGYLGETNLEKQDWFIALSESGIWLIQIIVYLIANISTILWYSGISILIFLVIMQRINPDLYEAADMDGATSWEKFWKVTLPELKVGITINIIYLVVFMATFEGNSVIKLIKENIFDVKRGLGYAAMQSWLYTLVMLVILLILLLAFNGVPKRQKKSKDLTGLKSKRTKSIKIVKFLKVPLKFKVKKNIGGKTDD